jgi:hypothetical protein
MSAHMPTTCRQCGDISNLRHGRCGQCGAAVNISEVVRHERRAALLRVVGDEWYWWIVEITALALIGLIALGTVPTWTLAIVALFLLRALSRLVVLLVRGVLELPV